MGLDAVTYNDLDEGNHVKTGQENQVNCRNDRLVGRVMGWGKSCQNRGGKSRQSQELQIDRAGYQELQIDSAGYGLWREEQKNEILF